jgi:hypothetical protein
LHTHHNKANQSTDSVNAFRADSEPDAVEECEVCQKHFRSKAELQLHLRMCVNTGRILSISLQHLTDEQLPALEKPSTNDSQSHESQLCGEHVNSADVFSHVPPIPDFIKCAVENCTLMFSSPDELGNHIKVHIPATQWSCDVCGRIFSNKLKLKLHMQRHSQLRPYNCDVPGCKYSAKVAVDLYTHKKKTHASFLFQCLLCGMNIKNHHFYKLHMAKHNTETPGVFKCLHRNCKKLFRNGGDLRKHLQEVRRVKEKVQCEICSKYLSSKSLLLKHQLVHSEERHFKCEFERCFFLTKTLKGLQLHQANQHNDLTCRYCNLKFIKDESSLRQHLSEHETDTPGVFKCLHIGCRETFTLPSDLISHMMQHKLHQCDVPGCQFTTKYKSNLLVHRRYVHSINLHTCQLCNYVFNRTGDFNEHMKSHETGDPGVIKCIRNQCKQTFTSGDDLKKHLERHTRSTSGDPLKNPGLECKSCIKVFKCKWKLWRHVKKHESATPFLVRLQERLRVMQADAQLGR